MEKQLIVSVGREFGSAGHVIAKQIADYFNISLYDKNLLNHIADERNVDAETLHRYDENPKNSFFTRTVRGHSSSPEEHIAMMQFDYIRQKAAEGESFVIIGRCAESVLKDNPNMISIFVLGDMEEKILRTMQCNDISRDKAKKMIEQHDKKRKSYHNFYCEGKWGDSRNYDLSINSSKLGIDETSRIIIDYIESRQKIKSN